MLNEQGYEIPDNTPVEMPTRLRLPQTRASQIQGFIRQEMSRQAQEQGHETFEEANDLDVDDGSPDFGPTKYEQSAEFGYGDIETLAPADQRGDPVGGAAGQGNGDASPHADAPRPAPANTVEAVK